MAVNVLIMYWYTDNCVEVTVHRSQHIYT